MPVKIDGKGYLTRQECDFLAFWVRHKISSEEMDDNMRKKALDLFEDLRADAPDEDHLPDGAIQT